MYLTGCLLHAVSRGLTGFGKILCVAYFVEAISYACFNMTDKVLWVWLTENNQPYFEYDWLRFGIITTNVLSLEMLLNCVEITFNSVVGLDFALLELAGITTRPY